MTSQSKSDYCFKLLFKHNTKHNTTSLANQRSSQKLCNFLDKPSNNDINENIIKRVMPFSKTKYTH